MSCSKTISNKQYDSKFYEKGKFKNEEVSYNVEFVKSMPLMWDFVFNKPKNATPQKEIPIIELTQNDLYNLEDNSVIRLAHSTLLLKLDHEFYLTDPVFSKRASPYSFIGPKRFHESPINIENLPPIKAVILSHDHYDHLDEEAIKKLKNKVETFYVPLGVGDHLISFGVEEKNIIELDWWQSVKKDDIEFRATPAQHFSGRGLFDSNKTLWASWIIKTSTVNLFFSGDSGYFGGFKEIGWNYGPFDMTFIEAGAYNEKWKEIHMMPFQTIQAHIDLKGKNLFPIHNGTFDLALHNWYEPFEKISALAKEKEITVSFPKMGESVSLIKHTKTNHWWRE